MTDLQEFLIAAAVVIVCILGGVFLTPALWAFTHPATATAHLTHRDRARARSILKTAEKRRLVRRTFPIVELEDAENGEYLEVLVDGVDGTELVWCRTTDPSQDDGLIGEPIADVTIHEIAPDDHGSVPRVEYSMLCNVAADAQDQEFLEDAELVEVGEPQIAIYVPAGLGLPA